MKITLKELNQLILEETKSLLNEDPTQFKTVQAAPQADEYDEDRPEDDVPESRPGDPLRSHLKVLSDLTEKSSIGVAIEIGKFGESLSLLSEAKTIVQSINHLVGLYNKLAINAQLDVMPGDFITGNLKFNGEKAIKKMRALEARDEQDRKNRERREKQMKFKPEQMNIPNFKVPMGGAIPEK